MPPADLVEVLKYLPDMSNDALIVGPDTLDDAGVYRLDEHTALVQTVDFFPPVVDDPVWFGRIAAANSLSDVYAMGGRPLTVLNIVGFPAKTPVSILGQILRGGAEKILESGAALAGGHSVRDSEVKYGLSVTGIVHPDRLVSNAGARPGDVLVLTKPLGMGAVSTAIKKQEKLDEALVEAACRQMAELNRDAAEAACATGATAMTDVTGFGLAGHLFEMAQGSGTTAEIVARDLPLFECALDLAERKLVSAGAVRTRLYLGNRASVADSIPVPLQQLLFDAETSGGLLIAVPADRADRLVQALRDRRTAAAAVVGRIVPRDGEVALRFI